ncbi:hypothetical protein BC628DRAFT_590769 [Trametes gibbosa]|nr:hypothetical protein BC628DRAFT_590769 [Trametes gibbosa]
MIQYISVLSKSCVARRPAVEHTQRPAMAHPRDPHTRVFSSSPIYTAFLALPVLRQGPRREETGDRRVTRCPCRGGGGRASARSALRAASPSLVPCICKRATECSRPCPTKNTRTTSDRITRLRRRMYVYSARSAPAMQYGDHPRDRHSMDVDVVCIAY